MDMANVRNHTREKETCRERQRQRAGKGGRREEREIERHRQAGGEILKDRRQRQRPVRKR